MTKKKTTNKWIKGHLKDKYVKMAKKENLKSRASYKFKQINDKYGILKEGDSVIDLGAAPGGWSQIAKGIVKDKGLVMAIDLLKISNLPTIEFIQGDVLSDDLLKEVDDILNKTGADKVDLVMSDMAPNLTGIQSTDAARANELNIRALFYAKKYLKKNRSFLVKLFRNEMFDDYLREVKKVFGSVYIHKPDASRSKSSEIYLIAKDIK